VTRTDNRKHQYRRFGCQYCDFWYSIIVAISWLICYRAHHHWKSGIWRGNLDAICHSSREVIISGFWDHIWHFRLSVTVALTCQHYFILFYTCTWSYTQCRWTFNCTFCSLGDISISGFGHHFWLSLIIGILESPRYTSCEFAMVECHRFTVGILMIYVIVSEILLLPVTCHVGF